MTHESKPVADADPLSTGIDVLAVLGVAAVFASQSREFTIAGNCRKAGHAVGELIEAVAAEGRAYRIEASGRWSRSSRSSAKTRRWPELMPGRNPATWLCA